MGMRIIARRTLRRFVAGRAGHEDQPKKGIVWIKWIGTHRDYDRIDVKKVKHE